METAKATIDFVQTLMMCGGIGMLGFWLLKQYSVYREVRAHRSVMNRVTAYKKG